MRQDSAEQASPEPWALSSYQTYLAPCFLCFIVGVALAYLLRASGEPAFLFFQTGPLLSIALILLGLIIGTDRNWITRLSVWLFFLLMGGACFQWRAFTPAADDVSHWIYQSAAPIQGILTETDPVKKRAYLTVDHLNGQPASGKVLIYLSAKTQQLPEAGSRIQLSGQLMPPYENRIPGAFNQKQYLLNQQVTTVMKSTQNLQVLDANPQRWFDPLFRLIAQGREKITHAFKQKLDSPDSEVLGGLVIGDHAIPLDKVIRKQFIQTGLIHLLAASGLNVAIVGGCVMALCQRIFSPALFTRLGWSVSALILYRLRILLAMAAVGLYALLTGLPPSIQRAGSMMELAFFLKLLDQELTPLMLLGIAVSVIVGLNPDVVGNIGFQFSVLTTFGLITMVPPLQEKLKVWLGPGVSGTLLVPIVAQLWVFPLSVFYFNQFPIHSLLLNLAALILVTPLTAIGFTAGACCLLWEPLGEWISLLAWPFLKGLLWLVAWGDSLSWAQWTLASPEPAWVFGFYLLLLLGVFCLHTRLTWSRTRKFSLVAGYATFLIAVLSWQRWTHLWQTEMNVIPLSKHHAAFLLKPAGTDKPLALIPATLSKWDARNLLAYLKHHNQPKLAGILLIPPPQDSTRHINDDLLQALARETSSSPAPFLIDLTGRQPTEHVLYGDLALKPTAQAAFQIGNPHFCLEIRDNSLPPSASNCEVKYRYAAQGPYVLSTAATQSLETQRSYQIKLLAQHLEIAAQ